MNRTIKCMIFGALACLAASSCGKQEESSEKGAIEVKVWTAQPSQVAHGKSYSGTLEESSGSTLSFPVAGTVKSIAVDAGQYVSKGQLIAILDEASFKHPYDIAESTLRQAEDAYKRMKSLHDSNSLPEIQWVEVQSKLEQARSAFEIAKKNLNDTKLYAPFSGYISEKSVDMGHNVIPGMPVAKIVKLDNIKVCISVPETEVSKISNNNTIEIRVPALDNQTFFGRITEKGVAADALSRSYQVKAQIPNESNKLLPGMLCTVNLSDGNDTTPTILIPRNIIQLDSDNRNFVWVVDDGKAKQIFITLGGFVEDKVVVTSGLTDGMSVIVEGQQKVSDGMDVAIIK